MLYTSPSQRIVPSDSKVVACLVDGGGVSMDSAHRRWAQNFGVKEFDNICNQKE